MVNMIDVSEHKAMLDNKDLTGVFVYSNDCNLCRNQIKKLGAVGINVRVVDCTLDAKYYLGLGFDDMPSTVVYIRGEKRFESTGEMFDKQLKELNNLLKSFVEEK